MVAATSLRVLVIGSQSTASDGTYQKLVAQHQATQGDSLVRAEMVDRIIDGAAVLEAGNFNSAVICVSASELHAHLQTLLPSLSNALAADGRLEVYVAESASSHQDQLKSAGFSNVSIQGSSITATKGASAAAPKAVPLRLIRSRPSAKKASLWATTPVSATTPTIDESTLLTSEDLKRKEAIQRPDCDVKRTRKACKNCTCGLREILLEEASDLPATMQTEAPNGTSTSDSSKKIISTGAPTSSCGNCYLGDAFRCASCPYLGLPSFEPGQKVDLSSFGDDL